MTSPVGKGWAAGLLCTIKDTKNHVISSETAVVIHDKYPKAKHHYLVLPKEDIPDIFHLKPSHLPLLEELHLLAQNVIEVKRCKMDNFKIGFHAQPSMQRLHLHVISKDFVSDCLKTKKHWASFNTQLFLPYQDAYAQLESEGCIKPLGKERVKELADCKLLCNQCEFVGKNMPDLKKHLDRHWKDQE